MSTVKKSLFYFVAFGLVTSAFAVDATKTTKANEARKPAVADKNDNTTRARKLASDDKQADLEHYHSLARRLGVDIGLMVPFGDYNGSFNLGQTIGMHFIWEAIPPFGFIVSMLRSSSTHKTDPANGKLSVTAFTIGTQASFPIGRFSPFVKLSGGFYFNDVSFEAGRNISSGYDTTLTTVGMSVGFGFDFIVGREISLGLDGQYHYMVPKKIQTNLGEFNLGSSMAVINFRVNF